jgi:hypothetical protein
MVKKVEFIHTYKDVKYFKVVQPFTWTAEENQIKPQYKRYLVGILPGYLPNIPRYFTDAQPFSLKQSVSLNWNMDNHFYSYHRHFLCQNNFSKIWFW